MKILDIDTVFAMTIIAFGNFDGTTFEYAPKLPSCFAENLNFQSTCCCHADFLRLTVNDQGRVDCWFINQHEDSFYYELSDIKKIQPILYVSLITHIFDMIENVKED